MRVLSEAENHKEEIMKYVLYDSKAIYTIHKRFKKSIA